MPKDDINYRFTENGIVYDFYDVFVPAENFRQPSLFTWGKCEDGQLGTNDITPNRLTPVTTFAGGTTWKSVACGSSLVAAIKTDGTLWTWGSNSRGQLGINNAADRSTPVTTFAGGNNWKSVSTNGYDFDKGIIAAIKTDGSLWVWGGNVQGQLGINQGNVTRNTPVTTFTGGTTWKSVACGGRHTVAIKTDGSLWTWGWNSSGQLGINNTANRSFPVTTFAGGNDWKQVAAGESHTAAIKTDGSLWVWGAGGDGRLGTNNTITRSTPVTTFAGGNNWKQVFGGIRHSVAVKTDGTLWCWGLNENNQLGIGGGATRSTPVTTFAGGTNWKQVSCGFSHTLATKTDGTLWSWGNNVFDGGQTGTNGSNNTIPVTTFAGGNNWKQVACGFFNTAAIKYQPDP